MHRVSALLLALGLSLASACASAGGEATRSSGNANLIVEQEIQASSATNVHELITSLRPGWLQSRGVTGAVNPEQERGAIIVYLNQARIGTVAELASMPIGGITSLQFIDARTATQRWGTGHMYGAIVVSTSSAAGR